MSPSLQCIFAVAYLVSNILFKMGGVYPIMGVVVANLVRSGHVSNYFTTLHARNFTIYIMLWCVTHKNFMRLECLFLHVYLHRSRERDGKQANEFNFLAS